MKADVNVMMIDFTNALKWHKETNLRKDYQIKCYANDYIKRIFYSLRRPKFNLKVEQIFFQLFVCR